MQVLSILALAAAATAAIMPAQPVCSSSGALNRTQPFCCYEDFSDPEESVIKACDDPTSKPNTDAELIAVCAADDGSSVAYCCNPEGVENEELSVDSVCQRATGVKLPYPRPTEVVKSAE